MYQVLKLIKTNDTPVTNAYILLTVLLAVNFYTFYLLFRVLFEFNFSANKSGLIIFACIYMLIMYLINYYYLYRNSNDICEKYQNESKTQSFRGYILLGAYFIFTFILFITVASYSL